LYPRHTVPAPKSVLSRLLPRLCERLEARSLIRLE
jgi:hypothetical protein